MQSDLVNDKRVCCACFCSLLCGFIGVPQECGPDLFSADCLADRPVIIYCYTWYLWLNIKKYLHILTFSSWTVSTLIISSVVLVPNYLWTMFILLIFVSISVRQTKCPSISQWSSLSSYFYIYFYPLKIIHKMLFSCKRYTTVNITARVNITYRVRARVFLWKSNFICNCIMCIILCIYLAFWIKLLRDLFLMCNT